MKKFAIASALVTAWLIPSIPAVAGSVTTLTMLDRGEPYDSMIAHADTIWIGQNRKDFNTDYSVSAYNKANQLLSRITIGHSIMSMKAHSATKILVSGINPQNRLTEYSLLEMRSGQISKQTTSIPMTAFATFWIGSVAGKNFFADHGGNPEDDQLGVPAQTVFSYSGGSPRYLTTRLAMPTAGIAHGEKLIIVSRAGIGQGASFISLVDTRTHALTRLNASPLNSLFGVEKAQGQNMFVSAEAGANRVIMFNGNTGDIVREFQTKGFTRTATTFGNCVVAGNGETNIVEFFNLSSTVKTSGLSLEVNLPKEEFYDLRKVTVDSTTGQTYARSSYPCNPMVEQCNQDNNRVVTWGEDDTAKVKALCLN